MDPLRCYVASPCGFADSTKTWYRKVLLPELSKHVDEVSDPWPEDEVLSAKPIDELIRLGEEHYKEIKRCQLLVAVLDQEPPDNGTVCEVVHAAGLGKPVIGYRSDKRLSGEPGAGLNLMIRAAIHRSEGAFVTNWSDLIAAVIDTVTKLRSSQP